MAEPCRARYDTTQQQRTDSFRACARRFAGLRVSQEWQDCTLHQNLLNIVRVKVAAGSLDTQRSHGTSLQAITIVGGGRVGNALMSMGDCEKVECDD